MIDDKLHAEIPENLPESYGPTVESQSIPHELLQSQPDEQETQPSPKNYVAEHARIKKGNEEKNFAAMRNKLEQLEKERDEALRKLQEKDDFDINLGPDDLAEGKHLTRVQKELKKLKEELSVYKTQTMQATTEARIKAQFSDFDSVVTTETISQLKEIYPELASTLQTSPDLYTQAVSAYTLIKKLGIVPESTYAPERQKAQMNIAKPRPSSSVSPQHGDSPLSKANAFSEGLTDDLKTQLFKEMNAARRGY